MSSQTDQEVVPLTKSDLTRMVVRGTYSPEEMERIVRRSCLSFAPTDRDMDDLRRLGASDRMLDAVDSCRQGAVLTARLSSPEVTALTGNVAEVGVEVLRGERPAGGVLVRLAGSGDLQGAGEADVSAVTDRFGRATLRIPAAGTPDRYLLQLRADGEQLEGQTTVVLQVRPTTPPPGPAPVAAVEPERREEPPPVSVRQRDPSPSVVQPASAVTVDDGPWVTMAMGQGALRKGDVETAIALYREATVRAPNEGAAWLGLGRALAAQNQPRKARDALRRAATLDSAYQEEAEAELARLPALLPTVEFSLWGGASFANAGTAELLAVQIGVRPVVPLLMWLRYDGGLGIDLPALMRGSGDPRALAAGGELTWGPEDRLATRFEVGRQEGEDDLLQYMYRAEQRIALAEERDGPTVEVGAFLGRWFDRDDWLVHGRLHVPATSQVALRPGIAVGETVGTVSSERVRRPAGEVRAELGLETKLRQDISFSPVLSYGLVEDREDAETGSLLEVRVLFQAELGDDLHLQGFLRHQRPPFSDAFTSIAAGIRMGVSPLP